MKEAKKRCKFKVEVRRYPVNTNEQNDRYEVWLVRGVQSFRLAYTSTKSDCTWYAKMLKAALEAQ